MRILDISWPICNQMTTYKNKSDVMVKLTRSFDSDGMVESHISFGTHTGTHIDAPSHFVKNGLHTDSFLLTQLIGHAYVLDFLYLEKNVISSSDLAQYDAFINQGDIILCKTKNSLLDSNTEFNMNFVYLDESAAIFLVNKKIKAVGIDYLGIERAQKGHQTHMALMSAGIPIIEGLRLIDAQKGSAECICLPLSIIGVEAAPARAILIYP